MALKMGARSPRTVPSSESPTWDFREEPDGFDVLLAFAFAFAFDREYRTLQPSSGTDRHDPKLLCQAALGIGA